jgi:hypothetical protein
MTDALLATKITHIDLSENNMLGFKGRELKGFLYFLKKFMIKGQAFQCRHSQINSQGLICLTHCLGQPSTLTYLDISDNMGGLDPEGRPTNEGITVLAKAIAQSFHLKTLKIGRNMLKDSAIELLAEAVQVIPQFQDLDITGNQCKQYGMRAMREAVISHSIICEPL